jgi:hypothetical protein
MICLLCSRYAWFARLFSRARAEGISSLRSSLTTGRLEPLSKNYFPSLDQGISISTGTSGRKIKSKNGLNDGESLTVSKAATTGLEALMEDLGDEGRQLVTFHVTLRTSQQQGVTLLYLRIGCPS